MAKTKPIKPPSTSVSYAPSSKGTMAKTKTAGGTYLGSGVRNPVGKIRDMGVGANPLPPSKLRKPPKSVA